MNGPKIPGAAPAPGEIVPAYEVELADRILVRQRTGHRIAAKVTQIARFSVLGHNKRSLTWVSLDGLSSGRVTCESCDLVTRLRRGASAVAA